MFGTSLRERIPESWHPYLLPSLLVLITLLHLPYVFCGYLSPTAKTSIQAFVLAQLCRLAFLLLAPYYALKRLKREGPATGDLLGLNAILLAGDALRLFWMCNRDYFLERRMHRHHPDLFRRLYYGVLIAVPVCWSLYIMTIWDRYMCGQTWTFKLVPFRRRTRAKVVVPPLEPTIKPGVLE